MQCEYNVFTHDEINCQGRVLEKQDKTEKNRKEQISVLDRFKGF
jgi:hypothetical protein